MGTWSCTVTPPAAASSCGATASASTPWPLRQTAFPASCWRKTPGGLSASKPEPARQAAHSTVADFPEALRALQRSSLRVRPDWQAGARTVACPRSEEHTSELQSLMRISYAVFCLKKKKDQVIKTK